MAEITIPNAQVPVCTCPHCGARLAVSADWYRALSSFVQAFNLLKKQVDEL